VRVLNICDADNAGVGIKLTEAVNALPGHQARHIRMVPHKFGYPCDIQTRDPETIKKWVEWADVVNTHIGFRPLRQGGERLRPKHLIVTYHGRHYRRHHHECHINAKEAGAVKSLCTTPDLSQFGGAEWLPTAIPATKYARMRRPRNGGKPVVCMTPSEPTSRRAGVRKVREALGDRKDLRLLVVAEVKHSEALWAKSVADIFIDRFELGLGVSGLEAMAMGIPTIANACPETEGWIRKAVGHLPYCRASVEEIGEAVDKLLTDQAFYDEWAYRAQRYIWRWHNYPVVAQRYVRICKGVMAR